MKKAYKTIDQAYRELTPRLMSFAKSHLINQDESIDAVHDGFQRVVEYISKNPGAKIQTFILYREIIRACRRRNKQRAIEVPVDFNSVARQYYTEE